MKKVIRVIGEWWWVLLLPVSIILFKCADTKKKDEPYIPRNEVGKDTVWHNDSSYIITTTIDSVYYDPDTFIDPPERR